MPVAWHARHESFSCLAWGKVSTTDARYAPRTDARSPVRSRFHVAAAALPVVASTSTTTPNCVLLTTTYGAIGSPATAFPREMCIELKYAGSLILSSQACSATDADGRE